MSKKPNYLKISNLKNRPKCLAPWLQMWAKVMPQGYDIKPCCVYEDEFNTDSIEEYLNSDELKELTKTLEKGELPPGCWRCTNGDNEWIRYEKYVKKGKELAKLEDIKEIFKDVDDQFTMLDIRPGNLCNLKCRMCNSSSSTEIAKENAVMKEDKELLQGLEELYKDSASLPLLTEKKEYFKKYSDHTYSQTETHQNRIDQLFNYAKLHRLKLLGGEPSIDPAIISIMQHLIDKGYSNDSSAATHHGKFQLQIVTNMTNVNKVWKDYFKKLNVKITASVDGAGRTFEYQRYPAKWKTIERNIKAIKPAERGENISMNIVMTNILYLDIKHWIPELQKLQNETADFNINFIECPFPKHMSINIIPQKYKKMILKDIKYLIDGGKCKGQVEKILKQSEKELTKSMFREGNINLLKAFFMIMMKQDKLRKQNIFDINYTKEMYNEYVVD